MRHGVTLIELLIVLSLVGLLALAAFPAFGPMRDRWRVEDAVVDVVHLHWRARQLAQGSRWQVALDLAPDVLRIRRVDGGRDSVALERAGPSRRGVSLSASRRTVRFGPTGVGWGAANTTIVLSRGAAQATLVTSRLGRLRRAR